ncbi:hypothetical protein PFUM301597_16150 [Pseudomonas fluorescens]
MAGFGIGFAGCGAGVETAGVASGGGVAAAGSVGADAFIGGAMGGATNCMTTGSGVGMISLSAGLWNKNHPTKPCPAIANNRHSKISLRW